MQEPPAIVLVHGFAGGERDYRALKKFLAERNHKTDLYEFFYVKQFGQVPIKTVAEAFAAYVDVHLQDKPFYVVGYSQGGLIFRAAAMLHPEIFQNVQKVITVCTPHHGSLIAYFGLGKGVSDLRPGSKFLREINAIPDGIEYYAIYNPIDPIVVPGTSARFERAVKNKRVVIPSHFLTFGKKETLDFIESVIFNPSLT